MLLSFIMEIIMAYQGYLIKVGNYTIPHKYIKASSYNATLIIQDLDSYRDANGILHRTALSHKANKIEFETPAMLTDAQMSDFLSNIQANYAVAEERKVSAKIYVPELNDYLIEDMYMPDPQFSIYGIFNDVIFYNPVRIAFIAY